MMPKVAMAGVSLILVVGVIVGVVSITHRGDSGKHNPDDSLGTGMKAVQTVCAPTDYKDSCMNALSPLANKNGNITPKELVQAIFNVAVEEVQKVFNKSGSFGENEPRQKMALEDCQDLLSSAVDELQASISMVGDSQLHTLNDRVAELQNWLSAVISYQETCLDGLQKPEIKSAMTDGMINATQMTSNALAIVSGISDFYNAFKLPTKLSSTSRRLLHTEVDKDGYPTWFSAADRKLLAKVDIGRVQPNAIVAKDGSGQFTTIAAALAAYPKNLQGRYVIYIKAGIYDEYITVTKDQKNVFMYGDGPRKTIVTGHKNNRDGVSTYQSASFSAIGDGFLAKSMGFTNTAGPEGHQAVALRVQSDMAAFYNCRMDGYQDTLYAQTHRQFYRNCVISGTVDFIFGDGSTMIQNSLIIARRPMDNQQNTVTAHGRKDKRETTGIVIHNCRIVPEEKLFADRFKIPTYLGRPWKEYSRTVIMESELGDFIQPAGWLPWAGNFALDTLYYAEYANRGPGAKTDKRVNWKGYRVIDRTEALQFTAGPFIQGDQWLKSTGTPFMLGLKR